MSRDIDRRDFVRALTVAGVAGVAGCTTSTGGGDGGDTDTATSTPTSTPTESSGGDGEMTETTTAASMSRDSPIQYGVLLPLTGDLGSVGKPMRDAAVLPATQLNGMDMGVTIEENVQDTQTSPSAGISAANSLVNAGVPGVCGPASSGVNIQVTRQVFIPSEVVGCSPSSTSPAVTGLDDDDFVFRTAPSDALQGQVMAQVADGELGVGTAVTMYVNNDYGSALSESFASSFESAGGAVQKQIAFEKQQPSYTSKLQEALSDDPDLLVVIGYPASGVQLFKDYYADFEGGEQVLVTDGLQDPQMQSQIGNPMENVTGTAPNPSGPSADAFASLYEDEYGRAPGIFNAHSYDASAVLILANARAGENSGPAVREQMRAVANPAGGMEVTADNLAEGVEAAMAGEDVHYAGASSPVDFDDNGDMKTVTYSVWEFAPDTDTGVEVIDTVQFEA
jgi:ABC-type branched-subunit amino acid transport system substrate-binding protein